MNVTSNAFVNNGMIPRTYTGFGKDISPDFQLEGISENTASVAIVLDDLDVPFIHTFTHWIIWNMQPAKIIPQAIPGGEMIDAPIKAVQGKAWGKHIYRGPKQPPFLRKAHRYRFTVFALDTMLEISPDSNKRQLLRAMTDHIIDSAELTGIYKRGN